MRHLPAMIVGLLLLVPAAAQAGVLFEMRTEDFRTGEIETSLGYADQGYVKLGLDESTVEGRRPGNWGGYGNRQGRRVIVNEGQEIIFRPEGGRRLAELILVNHPNRSYRVINGRSIPYRRDMDRRGGNDDYNGQIDVFGLFLEAMQNGGQDRGGNYQQGGPGYKGKPWQRHITVRRTNRTEDTWFGRCVIWERFRRNVRTHEVCVVDPSQVEYGAEILDETAPMADFYDDIVARIGRETTGVFFALSDVQGFPVLTRTFGNNGEVISEREFIRARSTRLGQNNFLPPRGYRQEGPR